MYVGLNPLEFALVLDLSLNLHVDYICARANARLHYLKRLKRAGLPTDRLAIRHQTSSWILRSCLAPRLEELSDRTATEAIQRRAIRNFLLFEQLYFISKW